MKLQKLIISNFRGLKGNENIIDFSKSDIIFLIGQNNVGKSTYLRAYEFFVTPKQKATKEDFYNYDSSNKIEIEGVFLKEEGDDELDDFVGSGRTRDPDWVDKWVNPEGLVRIRKTWSNIGDKFAKETFSPNDNQWVENGFGGMDSLFTKYSPEPIAINAMETEETLTEKVNKLMQDRYLRNIREYCSALYETALNDIKQLQSQIANIDDIILLNEKLNSHFKAIFSKLTLKIQADKEENIKLEDAFKKNYTVQVEKDNTERYESFIQYGHGVIRQVLFNFISFLKENTSGTRKEYLILFDEPELFLHPHVIFKLRDLLYSLADNSPYQILCATHSPMMIDLSKQHPSLIRVVKSNDEKTKTNQIFGNVYSDSKEKRERVQMINRFNPHICEAFYADNVILVEGDTETIVYRDLLKRFFPNEEIFVLNTGSKNNMPFFQEILTEFRIKHCVIHDADTEFNANGNRNSAWTLNQKIWDLIEKANREENGLARRYVHIANFENAHKYHLLSGKDKPLQAYRFAKTIQSRTENIPDCLRWLIDLIEKQEIVHDMDYINAHKKTLDEIRQEETSYMTLADDENESN